MKNNLIIAVSFCLLCIGADAQQTNEAFQNIEPSLTNGFHARFQIDFPKEQNLEVQEKNTTKNTNSPHSTNSTQVASSTRKAKKYSAIAQLNFNFKKRIKNIFPYGRKTYKPYLCASF